MTTNTHTTPRLPTPFSRAMGRAGMRAGAVGCFFVVKGDDGIIARDSEGDGDGQHSTSTQLLEAPAKVSAWKVVVLNDPVNLMSYVVKVFKTVFGFSEPVARKHMLEVHELGRSVVWTGDREKAEAYVFTLHQWHLSAILESDEATGH